MPLMPKADRARPRNDAVLLDWLETFGLRVELAGAWPGRVRVTTVDAATYEATTLRRAAIAAMDDQERRDVAGGRRIQLREGSERDRARRNRLATS